MLGGIDVVLRAPAGECIGDAILRVCQRHWKGHACVFQDVAETATHYLSDPWVWAVGASKREFFVYRDQEAAISWEENGAVKANRNLMFYFILGEPLPQAPDWLEVAVVFDYWTPAVRRLVKQLRSDFLSLAPMRSVA